ncbi:MULTISPECIES: hypothetical protein [Rhizobium]|uniref:Uncharacterized protein n=1 Tax=Rhizobium ruizarguesonis TaxID=2081791 RepID=A0AB38I0Y8_9HYPH|nr:hypothetical protein [Rhizobium ruizarguesonis]NEI05010.1 hypothetical protein [Rhizobium ruizarguesonis]NEI28578.1 hypothetical protein [Rhizobium ruizarguesonis]TAY94655.1 hypothetical protein ELH85_16450 [Rhizobium ruizarguesonis]TAZ79059.1 hypothetical protein ELH68_15370 [Rhizobium ruizarguesonis]TBA05435.1 hypothetical protein ELH64_13860 [Rhizobium ruizarguesonis]
MQRLLLSGLALAALAGTAFAQQPPAPPSAGTPPAAAEPGSPPPPPSPSTPDDDEQMTDRPDARPGDRPDYRWHGRRGDMGFRGFRGHRPLPPPPSKAAHFRIEDGNTRIDLKCAEDEPMKACADLLLQVMDRLQGQD